MSPSTMTPAQTAVYLGADTAERYHHGSGCSIRAAWLFLTMATRKGELVFDAGRFRLPRPKVATDQPPAGACRHGLPTTSCLTND